MKQDPTVHCIDVSRGADKRNVPPACNPLEGQPQPPGTIPLREHAALCADIEQRIKPTTKLINIMSALATGWLPWGIEWRDGHALPNLPLCGREYILCCGHTLSRAAAQALVDAGLLRDGGHDIGGRPTLAITEAGRVWLQMNWPR
jgi:hypothetical protein